MGAATREAGSSAELERDAVVQPAGGGGDQTKSVCEAVQDAATGAADALAGAGRGAAVAASAAAIAAAVRSGAAGTMAKATRTMLAMNGFAREVVERLVANGDARAAGRLCVAAVKLGPAQAEAVRQLAVQLLAASSTDTAAAVTAAFWEEAGAAGAAASAASAASATAGQSTLAGEASPQAAAEPPVEPAAEAAAAPASHPISSGAMASLSLSDSGSPALPAEPPAAPAPPPAPASAPMQASAEAGPAAGVSPAEPTPAELQRAAALVLAAAIVEAVQLGHGAAVVAVTEQLLAMGHQELIRALISAMVDARHSGEVGKVSVAALAAGKHRAVTELSGVLAADNEGALLGRVLLETTVEGARQLSGRASAAVGRFFSNQT